MPRKRKTLPKNFTEILLSVDLDAMKAVFEGTELDAYDGYDRRTALFFDEAPDELLRWLVGQGIDVDAQDRHGNTPLGRRAGHGKHAQLPLLVSLGADVDGGKTSPLFDAARAHRVEAVRTLVELGADIERGDPRSGRTPLHETVVVASNIKLPQVVCIARILLDAGARVPNDIGAAVERLGNNYQRVKPNLSDETRDAWGTALDELYAMFDVAPVAEIHRHDGVSTITVAPGTWHEQFNALWDHLVPPGGQAPTVQGEVIRIAGRVGDELLRNGGGNWDADYRAMLGYWLRCVAGGTPLDPGETGAVAAALRPGVMDEDAVDRLARLSVAWVRTNPVPVRLGAVDYRR